MSLVRTRAGDAIKTYLSSLTSSPPVTLCMTTVMCKSMNGLRRVAKSCVPFVASAMK